VEVIRKPEWLRIKIPSGENYVKVKQTLGQQKLHTVCEEAQCPNVAECWSTGTATIMIMGDTCTRGCRFCAVSSGKPVFLDLEEPKRIATAIKEWGLRYVVITAVCRDDLEDGGAAHMAKTIDAVKRLSPRTKVEPLIPDYNGNEDSLKKVIGSHPDVISHNIETVARLTTKVRDGRASYEQSLQILKKIKDIDSGIYTKSSLMLGFGETEEEVLETLKDLRSVRVDILTLGQYLQPTLRHLPVVEYITPQKFNDYKKIAKLMGFSYVAAGPLIRSSYKAAELFLENKIDHQMT
jgi:lipoic acid synthetase